MKGLLLNAVDALRKAGVDLREGWPKGFKPQEAWDTYVRLLAAIVGPSMPVETIHIIRQSIGSPSGHYAKAWIEGMELTHQKWGALTATRLRSRALWQDYFRSHDAFLMPVNIIPAFPHDHKLTFFERTVPTPEGKRLYADMLQWITAPTLTGCPASGAPIGKTSDNLPVGIQIMGPYLEDATPIDLAGRIGELLGGYEPPPGFSS